MRQKICHGLDEQIWCVTEGDIRKIYLEYYITENMIALPIYEGGNFTFCFPLDSSLVHQILLHEEKIITREEWLLMWLEEAVETPKYIKLHNGRGLLWNR